MNSLPRLISLAMAWPVCRLLPFLGALVVPIAFAQSQVQVPVMAAQVRWVGVGFELDGVIQPVKQSTVSAQAGGRVATLVVQAGDKVRAGQVLATIDDREAQTGVQRSQAEVAQAQAALRKPTMTEPVTCKAKALSARRHWIRPTRSSRARLPDGTRPVPVPDSPR